MKTFQSTFTIQTTSRTDIFDITEETGGIIEESKIQNGMVLISISGSTASITTIEYECGVVNDLRRTIEELVPQNRSYEHDGTWGDGNGYSHVRAALFKPSLALPIRHGKIGLGTWQQIVLLDFDNRPRQRVVNVDILGD
jgi:secondary thiamine-phosphate synthase enzyme